MLTAAVQRWRERRDSYRPAGEPFDPRAFEVGSIGSDAVASGFVLEHHYSREYPAARWRFGLYTGGELVGVAVFGDGMPGTLRVLPCEEGTELLRLVLLPSVKANGESWFVSRCFDLLRRAGVAGVVSFSDPVPRTTKAGRQVFGGHVGTVYQALSAVYTGRATVRTLRLFDDGTVFSARTWQKIRKQERGWRGGIEQLVAAGAAPPVHGEDLRAWALAAVHAVTRPLRHHGNFRYLFPLRSAVRRSLPGHLHGLKIEIKPYPKLIPAPPERT